MKRILFVILAAIVAGNISAQYIMVDTVKLNNAYRVLMADFDNANKQWEFFDAFPKTWMEFIATYQYVPDKGSMDSAKLQKEGVGMSQLVSSHLETFERLTSIPQRTYCDKVVNLMVGARLNGGASGALQLFLNHVMMNREKEQCVFDCLAKLRKGHQFEFWEFYWSNNVYQEDIKKEFLQMKERNKKAYPEETEIMSTAYSYFHDGVNFMSWGYLK